MPFYARKMHFFEKKGNLTPVGVHRSGPGRSSGSNCHFCQKNAFFGQKKAFFQKVHFIQKCSVTQNTVFSVFQKNDFVIQSKVNIFHQIQPTHPPAGPARRRCRGPPRCPWRRCRGWWAGGRSSPRCPPTWTPGPSPPSTPWTVS